MDLFRKRAQVKRTEWAVFRRWTGLTVRLSLVEIKSNLDHRKRYVLTRPLFPGEIIVSRHRTKRAALRAAERLVC